MNSSVRRSTYRVTLNVAPVVSGEGLADGGADSRSSMLVGAASSSLRPEELGAVSEAVLGGGSDGTGCRGGGIDLRARSRCALRLARPFGAAVTTTLPSQSQRGYAVLSQMADKPSASDRRT